jgi:hypothetical protein
MYIIYIIYFVESWVEVPNSKKSGYRGLLTNNCITIKELGVLGYFKNAEFQIYPKDCDR